LKFYRKVNTGTVPSPVWAWAQLYDVYGLMDKQTGNKVIRNEGGVIISDWKCYSEILDITTSDRIVDSTDVFDIVSIHDPNKLNRHYEIDCKYLPAGTLTSMGIGSGLTGQRYIKMTTITASAIAGINFTMPFAMDITMVMIDCTANVTGGTIKLRTQTTDISDAIVCAVSGAITVSENIVTAVKRTTVGQTLNFISNDAGVRATAYVIGTPI
jgi:hypothetical protein